MGTSGWSCAAVVALILAGCGGGGGDPGACSGSAQYCAGIGSGGSSGSGSSAGGSGSSPGGGDGGATTPVYVTNVQLQAGVSCTDIMQANGGRTARAWMAIQDAYQRGATNLDGDPQNGVPCDSYGFPI